MSNETKWLIDKAHSSIQFSVRHLMITHVHGKFNAFDASIYTTDKDFTTAEIDVWIDTTSIDTGNEKRDEHLMNSDFLNTDVHKQINFKSSTITKNENHAWHELWGELTMNGITKNVQLLVKFGGLVMDSWGNEKAGFNVTGKIDRSNWGLVWNSIAESGGILVSNEIDIVVEMELMRSPEIDTIIA